MRVTRQQNFVAHRRAGGARSTRCVAAHRRSSASRSTRIPSAAPSIACTGEPHCNFSVTETKTRLDTLIQALEERFGDEIAELRLHLDGCPHACAQHWVGDLGFQGTTVRDEAGKRQAGVRDLPARRPRRATPRSAARSSGACRARSWTTSSTGWSAAGSSSAGRRERSAAFATRSSDEELARSRASPRRRARTDGEAA